MHLTLDREEARMIAKRAGLPLAETEQRLSEMAYKGLIFSIEPEDVPTLYHAVPFVVGIYEFQVNNLTEGLLQDLADYWSHNSRQIAQILWSDFLWGTWQRRWLTRARIRRKSSNCRVCRRAPGVGVGRCKSLLASPYGQTFYHIRVENPDSVNPGVRRVILDGEALAGKEIPLLDDGQRHEVRVVVG